MQIGAYPLNTVIQGDSRELSKSIPDESVDMIFTDPVYQNFDDYKWLAETGLRILKPEGWLVAFYYTGDLPMIAEAMQAMKFQWQIIWHRNNEMKFRYAPTGKSIYVPAMVYAKQDKPHRHNFGFDLLSLPVFAEHSNHKWSKPTKLIGYYLEVFTKAGDLVYEPFAGGGAIPAVCKMFERNFIASEILHETATLAHERVTQTQAPLGLAKPNIASSGRVDSSRSPELFPAEVITSAKVKRQTTRR